MIYYGLSAEQAKSIVGPTVSIREESDMWGETLDTKMLVVRQQIKALTNSLVTIDGLPEFYGEIEPVDRENALEISCPIMASAIDLEVQTYQHEGENITPSELILHHREIATNSSNSERWKPYRLYIYRDHLSVTYYTLADDGRYPDSEIIVFRPPVSDHPYGYLEIKMPTNSSVYGYLGLLTMLGYGEDSFSFSLTRPAEDTWAIWATGREYQARATGHEYQAMPIMKIIAESESAVIERYYPLDKILSFISEDPATTGVFSTQSVLDHFLSVYDDANCCW